MPWVIDPILRDSRAPVEMELGQIAIPTTEASFYDDEMNNIRDFAFPQPMHTRTCLPWVTALLLWMAQPPFAWSLLSCIALVPLLFFLAKQGQFTRRDFGNVWLAGCLFWLLSLQGLRHAHGAMFLGWLALSFYLATYWVWFVYASRWFHLRGVPFGVAVIVAWVGQEVLRNYLLTGLSACMLGHSVANLPLITQVASVFGTYGVTLFLVAVNVITYGIIILWADRRWSLNPETEDEIDSGEVEPKKRKSPLSVEASVLGDREGTGSGMVAEGVGTPSDSLGADVGHNHGVASGGHGVASGVHGVASGVHGGCWGLVRIGRYDAAFCVLVVVLVLGFGASRLRTLAGNPGQALGTFLLVQRSEQVEYTQPASRAIEIYQAYARETLDGLKLASGRVDAVIWPESMYSAGSPWVEVDSDMPSSEAALGNSLYEGMSGQELRRWVSDRRDDFYRRSAMLLDVIDAASMDDRRPDLIVGCGVMRYAEQPEVYCGIVQIGGDARVRQWYGKNHLVMFGEYIPLVSSLPFLRNLLPPGMGLQRGDGARVLQVNGTNLLPNICIETAVERVAVNHLRDLKRQGVEVDAIVTVTNDGWFDDSSIIEHHLRCAQLVAAGTGRPILSSANNGPTAWIDSSGQIVEQVEHGSNGVIIAEPKRKAGETLYSRWGDKPAILLGLLSLAPLSSLTSWFRRRSKRTPKKNDTGH